MTREEYIDFANALKNNYTIDFDKLPEFCDMAISALSEKNWKFYYDHGYTQAKRDLSENKGEWIPLGGADRYACSACRRYFTFDATNFCPNCGADMRGGK